MFSHVITFDPVKTLDLAVSLLLAFALATMIGMERQYRQRSAGLRTNVLVAVGAAAFVALGERINGSAGASQISAYVVSGIGFLGAGAILKDGNKVWGLNTAATLWCSAAIGATCGIGLALEAALITVFVLAGNTLLRPLVNAINRAPMDERNLEAVYIVHAITPTEYVGEVRDTMVDLLEAGHYLVNELEVLERADNRSEILATLVSTSIEPQELDAIVTQIGKTLHVSHATWTSTPHES